MYFISVSAVMNLLLSLLLLLRGTLVLSIVFFAFSFLVSFIRKKIAKKLKLKWFSSVFISLFSVFLLFTAFTYVFPLIAISNEWDFGAMPEELVPGLSEIALFWFYSAFKIVLVALTLTVLFSPFLLLGSMILDLLKKKKWNIHIKTFIAVFICTLIGCSLLLFAFSWVPSGIIFYLYYG